MTGALRVDLHDVLVGHLHAPDARGRMAFRFDPTYLDHPQRPVLGQVFEDRLARDAVLRAPRREVLPRWFLNLLPERGTPLRRLVCRRTGIHGDDDAALLAALGAELPGAVRLSPAPAGALSEDDGAPEPGGPPGERLTLGLSSLGGVQLKLSMTWSGDRLVVPAKTDAAAWIVKFPGDREGLVANEATIMNWARAAGFEVPEVRRVPASRVVAPEDVERPGPEVLAIRRYDRSDEGRVHQEDFCQVLDRRPHDKYGATYTDVGRVALGLLGMDGAERFLRRLVLVVASGNGDAHLKNHALVYRDRSSPSWSPLYDQVATIAWSDLAPELAMKLWSGGPKSFGGIDRSAMLELAHRVGLTEQRAARAIDDTLEDLAAARHVLEGLPPTHLHRLEAHWQRTPLLAPLRTRSA